MKKKLVVVLALAAVLSFTACSKQNNEQAEDNNQTVEQDQTTEDTTTEDETAEDTTEDTQTETADNINAEEQEKLNAVCDAIREAYGDDYAATMSLDQTAAEEKFGLTSDLYDAYVAEIPMMSVQIDTLVAVHPTKGNEDAVVEALNAYRDTLLADTMQYPMNQVKIQASTVEQMGDYVFFFMLGYADDTLEDDAEILEAYTAQNQIAIDAVNSVLEQ